MKRLCSALISIGVLAAVAGCGDDGSSADSTTATTSATTTPATEPDAADFPVTITHKYGEITIDKAPERVVSIGFSDQDWLLALGVTPIAVRDWYGDQPFATWPWAQDELGARVFTAGHFTDNPVSGNVLVKLGFIRTGTSELFGLARQRTSRCERYVWPEGAIAARLADHGALAPH